MIRIFVVLIWLVVSFSQGFSVVAQDKLRATYQLKPSPLKVEIRIPHLSPGFDVDQRRHLSYEICICNYGNLKAELTELSLVNVAAPKQSLFTLANQKLLNRTERPGSKDKNTLTIAGNQFLIVKVDADIGPSSSPAKTVFHRLKLLLSRGTKKKEFVLEGAMFDAPSATKLVIGFPVRQGTWLNIGTSHRDSRFFTSGSQTSAQRFACDLSKLSDEGNFARSNKEWKKNETWLSYGQDVISVADGKVIDVVNGIRDNVPFSDQPATKITRQTIGGNSVFVDIGGNKFAYYAHLQPNSITVKKGDTVKKGQLLGKLGNSGQTTGPHLHFHICNDGRDPFSGEGVPFLFEKFQTLEKLDTARIDQIFENGAKWTGHNKKAITNKLEMPFGDRIIKIK